MTVELKKSREQVLEGPYNRFIYALKAPESKRQYPKRLEVFLNFINIEGLNLQEKLYTLYHKSKSDTEWLQDSLLDFIVFKKKELLKEKLLIQPFPTITNR